VSLEAHGNGDSEYTFNIFLAHLRTKRQCKTSGNIIFHTNWPTGIVEIATLYEFDENDRFFTTSCDPYMGHTLSFFFTHFTIKRTPKDGFYEK
jgi:hypothetical protein